MANRFQFWYQIQLAPLQQDFLAALRLHRVIG
jgi:hypothetical protein